MKELSAFFGFNDEVLFKNRLTKEGFSTEDYFITYDKSSVGIILPNPLGKNFQYTIVLYPNEPFSSLNKARRNLKRICRNYKEDKDNC